MRFVELWTLRRGVLAVPEPLDADGQDAAFERWTRDEPRLFERPENVDCMVVLAGIAGMRRKV
jgi:hypothetical protein